MPDGDDKSQSTSAEETPGAKIEGLLNEEIKAEKEKKTVKKPKPTLEGINAPVSTNSVVMVKPTLTVQEKRLISETEGGSDEVEEEQEEEQRPEPKLLPKSVVDRVNGQQKSGVGKIIGAILLLLLGFASYQIYNIWGINDNSSAQQQKPVQPAPQPVVDTSTTTVVIVPNATSTPATTTPTTTATKQLKINTTPTGWLNFRSGAGLNFSILDKVKPGEVYTYTETKSGWYKITIKDGRVGWVFGQYVTLQ